MWSVTWSVPFKCSDFHSWFIQTLHENELLNARKWGKCFHRKNLTRLTGLLYHHYWTVNIVHHWDNALHWSLCLPGSVLIKIAIKNWIVLTVQCCEIEGGMRMDCWTSRGSCRACPASRATPTGARRPPLSWVSLSCSLDPAVTGHSWTEASLSLIVSSVRTFK